MKIVDTDISDEFTSEIFRKLFRLTHDAILVEKPDSSIIDANSAAEELFGRSREELLRLKADDLFHLEGTNNVQDRLFSNPDSEQCVSFQTEIHSEDHLTIPVNVSSVLLQTGSDWVIISIIRDLKVDARAERASKDMTTDLGEQTFDSTSNLLISQEQFWQKGARYETLVENSLQGIAILDGPPFRYTYVNNAGSAFVGYSQEELQAFSPEDIEELIHWTDRPKILHLIGEILGGKRKAVRTATRFNTKNNDVIWLDLSMTGVQMQDHMSLVITFIDVTEQRRALADLLDTQRDLGIYASLLRHDLRNDLQVITGNTEVMRLSAPDNDIIQQCAEANVAGVKRMLEILTIFGKPEKEQMRLIAPMLESLSVEATKSYVGMVCQLHIDAEILMTRVAGGTMLPMVFRNLIRNSAKYAGEKPRVDIRVKQNVDFVDVRVSDNGPGIPESVKSRLFEKGVSTSGGGLGLYLSKKVVEAYGGSIELLEPANEREGAVFLVKLALASGEIPTKNT
jgi:PAS domain S-box-containing protein